MKNSSQKQLRFIISGGGTGGHIFPAIAIADALKRKLGHPDILFVGAKGRMEMEKVPAAGYPIEGLWISGLQRKLTLKNLSFPFKLISSLIKARRIIKKHQPDAVIGVGGYASGPTLQAAVKKGIPALIQEQNSFPGITNKLLAKHVKKICVAYPGMEKFFPKEKIVYTGNPIREQVIQIEGKRKEAADFFKLDESKKTILIVGGSQGALAINKGIAANLNALIDLGYQLIWQTGKSFFNDAESLTKDKRKGVVATQFINRMDLAYAMADVIVSRAGAIAISEICAVARPPVFVPLPTAAEDHQTKNGQVLVDNKAALMIKNSETEEKLLPAIRQLMEDEILRKQFSENLKKLAKEKAADEIAAVILQMIETNEK